MQVHRPSILRRPLKSESKATETTSDRQYEQEQEKLRAKANKSSATQDRLMRSLYPMPEDKLAAAADVQQHLQAVMAAKLSEQHEFAYKGGHDSQGPAVAQVLAVADDKPWLNPSLVYRNAVEEKQARRGHEEEVAAANRRMMAEAALRRSVAEQNEVEETRRALEKESFWNVGAKAGDRHAPRYFRDTSGLSAPLAPWAPTDVPTPAPAGRFNANCHSSSAMEALLSQAPTPAPTMAAAPAPVRERSTPYATSINNAAHVIPAAPPRRPANLAIVTGGSTHAPFANADNNSRHAPPPPSPGAGQRYASRPMSAQGRAPAPFARADEAQASHVSRPGTAAASPRNNNTAPWATMDTAVPSPTSRQQARSSAPWATTDGSGPAAPAPIPRTHIRSAAPYDTYDNPSPRTHSGRYQAPPTTINQLMTSPSTAPAQAVTPATRWEPKPQAKAFPWLA